MGTVQINAQDLAEDIEKYLRVYATTVTNVAADKLTEVAQESILDFYAAYTPKVYDRTFDYRDHAAIRYHHDNGKVMYGGVRLSSENMKPYGSAWSSTKVDPYYIVESASYGYHGLLGSSIVTEPSPINSLRDYFYSNRFRQEIVNEGHKVAQQQKYKVFQF